MCISIVNNIANEAWFGFDCAYYFPNLLGTGMNPSSPGGDALLHAVQDTSLNFVVSGNPDGVLVEPDGNSCSWPSYGESGKITATNAEVVAEAQCPPHCVAFDVIHEFLGLGSI